MIVLALLSPLIGPLLQIPTVLPMLAASLTILLLFLRPVSDGTLQGIQRFSGLGTVQVLQAFLRLIVGAGLLWLGWQAFGALLALPLGMLLGFVAAPLICWLPGQPQGLTWGLALIACAIVARRLTAGLLVDMSVGARMDVVLLRRLLFDQGLTGRDW